MTTRIGLISDVHASPVPLKQALQLFRREKVSDIICAGDICGYFESLGSTIALLQQYDCQCIIGNHDQSFLQDYSADLTAHDLQFLQALPETLELEIEHKSIFVVHAQPPSGQHGGIKLLDQTGQIIPQQKQYWENELLAFDADVLIVGHTHQVYVEQLGSVKVINPGSTEFNHSCMVLSLPDLSVKTYSLEDREIVKSWNFGMLYSGNNRYPTLKTHSS